MSTRMHLCVHTDNGAQSVGETMQSTISSRSTAASSCLVAVAGITRKRYHESTDARSTSAVWPVSADDTASRSTILFSVS